LNSGGISTALQQIVNARKFGSPMKHMKRLLAAGWKGRVTLAWKGNFSQQ
jgi:hypothetical protein